MTPRRSSRPSSTSWSATCFDVSGWSRERIRSPPSTSVTRTPNRTKTCAISTPTTPPPRITRLDGSSRVEVASRLVQYGTSSTPGMGGTNGADPAATMTLAARSVSHVALGPAHLDRAGADDARLPSDHPGPGRLHAPDVTAVVGIVDPLSRDHPVASRGGMRPVVVGPAGALGGGVQQRLRRHARPERARAADQVALHEHGGRADRGRGEAGGFSRRTPTDHDDVLIHGSSFAGRHARRRDATPAERRRAAGAGVDATLGPWPLRPRDRCGSGPAKAAGCCWRPSSPRR